MMSLVIFTHSGYYYLVTPRVVTAECVWLRSQVELETI